ncbi:trans-resveratrol di-O-methyltransferase [Ranunculus cassubicifolius]
MEMANGNGTEGVYDAQAHVWKYAYNYVTSMSLRCAVQLGIPDIISDHGIPITLSDLAKKLSLPQWKSNHLYRLMRILVHSGFFAIGKTHPHEEVKYTLTPPSELLLKSHMTTISPLVLLVTDPAQLTAFGFLSTFFKGTGKTPMEAAFGTSFYGYCAQHPEFNNVFNDAMASDSKFLMSEVIEECKNIFQGARSLVDVAGGTGTSVKTISEAFPELKCTVLDLPHVVSNMEGNENIEFVAGDMFQSVPRADIVLLKWILHNWSDEECIKILKRCKEAIPSKEEGGKVIIIDMVVNEKGNFEITETQLCLDICMMGLLTGKERTEPEWEKLSHEAGFTSYKLVRSLGMRSVIELCP